MSAFGQPTQRQAEILLDVLEAHQEHLQDSLGDDDNAEIQAELDEVTNLIKELNESMPQ